MYKKKYKNKYKRLSIWSKFCLNQEATTQRIGSQLPHVLAFKENYLSGTRWTTEEFSKAYLSARNQKGTDATNGMMRLLSLGHSSFRIWLKQQGVINYWLRRPIDKNFLLFYFNLFFFDMNPLGAYFINQYHSQGELTFLNASFWEKRAAVHRLLRLFNFDL